tara:strand:- start:5366 stop:5824 length:459 start_codon:yes stop_codon:yes gene_type:complete
MTASNNIRSLKIKPYNNIRPKGPAAIEDALLDDAAEMIKNALDNWKKGDKYKLKLDKLRDSYKKLKPSKRLYRPDTGRYGRKLPEKGKYGIPDHSRRLLKRLLKIKPEKTAASFALKRPLLMSIATMMSLADQRKLASGTLDDAPKNYGGRR